MEDRYNPYRFVIVACSAAALFSAPATTFANGVFLVNMRRTGLYDINSLAWVMATSTLMQYTVGGTLGSYLVTLTSCRVVVVLGGLLGLVGFSLSSLVSDIHLMFLTYGMVLGVGRGLVFTGVNVNLGFWFKENSSLASGMVFSGVAIGMLVHPRLVQVMTDVYSVDNALLLMGGLIFHACVCGMLLRMSKFEKNRRITTKREKALRKGDTFRTKFAHGFNRFKTAVLTNTTFLWFVVGICLFEMTFMTIMTFLPDFYNSHGLTPQEAALAASVTGVGALVARSLAGIMTNDPQIGTILLFSGNMGICATLTLFTYKFVETQAGRFVYSVCVGTYLSCIFVIIGPTTLQKVGLDNLPYGFGFILLCMGISDLIGPPLAMQVRFVFNSYYAVFVFQACLMFTGSACGFISEMFKKSPDVETAHPVESALLPATLVVEDPDVQEHQGSRENSGNTEKLQTTEL